MKTWPSVAVAAQTAPFLALHSEAARLGGWSDSMLLGREDDASQMSNLLLPPRGSSSQRGKCNWADVGGYFCVSS